MGTIDKTTYHLKCPECLIEESSSILDKGSNWNGSYWQSNAHFTNFKTEWSGGGNSEPNLRMAYCNICNVEPIVKIT